MDAQPRLPITWTSAVDRCPRLQRQPQPTASQVAVAARNSGGMAAEAAATASANSTLRHNGSGGGAGGAGDVHLATCAPAAYLLPYVRLLNVNTHFRCWVCKLVMTIVTLVHNLDNLERGLMT